MSYPQGRYAIYEHQFPHHPIVCSFSLAGHRVGLATTFKSVASSACFEDSHQIEFVELTSLAYIFHLLTPFT